MTTIRKPTTNELIRWQVIRTSKEYRDWYKIFSGKWPSGVPNKADRSDCEKWEEEVGVLKDRFDLAFAIDFNLENPEELPFIKFNPLRTLMPGTRSENDPFMFLQIDLRYKKQVLREAFNLFLDFEESTLRSLSATKTELPVDISLYEQAEGRDSLQSAIINSKLYVLSKYEGKSDKEIADNPPDFLGSPVRSEVWTTGAIRQRILAFEELVSKGYKLR